MSQEITKQEEKQNRLRSWAVWLSIAGAVWIILESLGLPQKLGIEKSAYTSILDAVGTILIAFGILNNPTDPKNF